MKDIAIFGAGGFGREVYLLIQRLNHINCEWNFIGFFDDNCSVDFGSSSIPFNYFGTVNDLNAHKTELHLVVAVGSPGPLSAIVRKISNPNVHFPNIIAPDAVLYSNVMKMGKGNVITSGCIFTDNITIGDFNIFNSKISVGHDVAIGDYNVFNPNTAISGNVKIGNKNFFGLNSAIIQGKNVGNNNKIGASTLMIRSAKNDESYFGVPGYKSI